MAKKMKRDEDWARAKRLCRLNAETVRMAKALGLNPRKLAGKIPSQSQPWKAPVHVWIHDLYEKMQEKAARRRAAKQAAQAECPNEPREAPPSRPCPIVSPPGSFANEPFPQAAGVRASGALPEKTERHLVQGGPQGGRVPF